MKAGSQLDERADATTLDATPPARRLHDLRQQFQDGGLAGAVRANDAQRLAGFHLEREVPDRPEFLRLEIPEAPASKFSERGRNEVPKAVVALAQTELLPHRVNDDGSAGHQMFSANSNSAR
jgi:hypothetical protein